MGVQDSYYRKDAHGSPIQKDFKRVVNYDDEGNEFITFEVVDYPSIQHSLGSVMDWSLDSLLKAGIDPAFGIHTGNVTRLEGIETVAAFDAAAQSILNESVESKND